MLQNTEQQPERQWKAEARALGRQKETARKAQEAITPPPLKLSGAYELFDLPKLQPIDINHLINLLPPLPKPQPEKKKRGRKPKPDEEFNDTIQIIITLLNQRIIHLIRQQVIIQDRNKCPHL